MSVKRSRFTNIRGKQVEFASELSMRRDRFYGREARSQKAQYRNGHRIGTNKGVKVPMKDKIT